MASQAVKDIYNKIFDDYNKIGSGVIIYVSDYHNIDIQDKNDTGEHSCNINYHILNKRSMDKINKYEYSYGCVYKMVDNKMAHNNMVDNNIITYYYKEHKRIKSRTFYDILLYSFDNIADYISNKEVGEYINPIYKKTIVDKLLTLNYDKYNKLYNNLNIQTVIKKHKCQICDSTEICGEINMDNEIIFYCKECCPYI